MAYVAPPPKKKRIPNIFGEGPHTLTLSKEHVLAPEGATSLWW